MEDNNEGFNKLIEKYDFDSPIKVTLVIEEDDEPDPFSLKGVGLFLADGKYIPSTTACTNNSEVHKKLLNIDNAQNKIANARQICKGKSDVKENNYPILINALVSPEEIQDKTQDISCHLLDFVADNLIHITKCYYFNFTNNKKQLGNDKKLQSEYINFKQHFFNLSYSTTTTILLPQEHNIPFIHNFINRVIKIANHSSWYQISFNELEILVREMLTWTKEKKHYHDLKFDSHNHETSDKDYSSTALTIRNNANCLDQDLNRPLDNDPRKNLSRKGTSSQPDIVPKTYLPVPRINTLPSMSDTTNYLTQEMISPLNMSLRTNDLPQDCSSNNCYFKNSSVHERTKLHNVYRENCHLQQDLNISPDFTQRPNRSNLQIYPFNMDHRANNPMEARHRLPCTELRINQSIEKKPSIKNSKPKTNNSSNYQAMNTIINKEEILLYTGPPNQKITISVDPAIFANIKQQNTNESDAYGTEFIKRRKTNDGLDNVNSSYYQKHNCSATTSKSHGDGQRHEDSRKPEYEYLNTDTWRSSTSRDSGCGGSPIYGSFHNEEMIEPLTEEQVSPVISHVTSMNPNAVNLSNGFCTVCGSTTNKMCIGCYQKYYCSSLCQIKDWDIHKYLCSS